MSIRNEQKIYLVLEENFDTHDISVVEAWWNEVDAEDKADELNAEEHSGDIHYYSEPTILKGYENAHIE